MQDISKIKNNSIDFISALHVLEHISDDELNKVFKKFKKIISTNGILMLATPAKEGLAHQIKKKKWIGFKDKTHVNLKNYKEWIDFFTNNNLKLIKASNDGLWDFPYISFKFFLKFFPILIFMLIQIFFGKLIIKPNDGETFIFILKFK